MNDPIPFVWPGANRRDVRRNAGLSPLSHRELEVVAALAEGLGVKGAARKLGLSPLTVKSHLQRIRSALRDSGDIPPEIEIGESSGLVFYCLLRRWID